MTSSVFWSKFDTLPRNNKEARIIRRVDKDGVTRKVEILICAAFGHFEQDANQGNAGFGLQGNPTTKQH